MFIYLFYLLFTIFLFTDLVHHGDQEHVRAASRQEIVEAGQTQGIVVKIKKVEKAKETNTLIIRVLL